MRILLANSLHTVFAIADGGLAGFDAPSAPSDAQCDLASWVTSIMGRVLRPCGRVHQKCRPVQVFIC